MAAPRSAPDRPWAVYSLLRLVFFAVPLAVVQVLSGNLVLSAIVAAIIGLCLSVILLDRQRGAVARRIEARVERRRPTTDESIEDDAIDGGSDQSSDSAAPSPRP